MHKINNAIYSYYHTDSVKGFAGFADKKHFLSCVKESVLGVKNSFESVKLYTDKKGKEVLKSTLSLFDDVILLDEQVGNEYFFALYKFDAYLLQSEPFLHFDFDFILNQKIEIDADIVAEFSENAYEYRNKFVEYVVNIKGVNKHIIDFVNTGCNGVYAYCCGVFGGNDLELIHQYAKDAKSLVTEYEAREKKGLWDILMIEQGYLSIIVRRKTPYLFKVKGIDYTHYIGNLKSNYKS